MSAITRPVIVHFPDLEVRREDRLMIAGPCSVESRDQLFTVAEAVKEAGFHFLRGGAFKPRTSPYSFQGLQEEGLLILREAAEAFDLKIVSEIIDVNHVSLFQDTVDILQIGTRNMSNFQMLKQLAGCGKPILLKRGYSARVEELLLAAEYLTSGGNDQVILCERGIRTFENATRATLDLSSVPIVKKLSPLPIIVDPSHSTGRSDLVQSMTLAALVAGADGVMIEVHPNPQKALSDGLQSLTLDAFRDCVQEIRRLWPYLK
ncbi:3-deoxy-7-phosphoheptulonate synthase [bacterium]|nr:3-deoxy-7-phosphoheptulonate synthase [candidate division CSSED10-310 bacterium]